MKDKEINHKEIENKEVFISYIDDDNELFKGYVTIIKITENYVTFKTAYGNTYLVPFFRILKIKLKET